MEGRSRRPRRERLGGTFVLAALLSAVLHTVVIVLALRASNERIRPAAPVAYTVEVVDGAALGGKPPPGPIGVAPKPAAAPPPPPEPPRAEPPPPKEKPPAPEPEPKKIAKAAPDAEPIAQRPTAKPTPAPVRTEVRRAPTGTPRPARTVAPAKPKVAPTAAVATPGPKATAAVAKPAPRATAAPPPAAAKPAAQVARRGGDGVDGAVSDDLDRKLAAAIRGVEERVQGSGGGGAAGAGDGPIGTGGGDGGGEVRGLEFVMYYNAMLTRIKERWVWVGERRDLRVTVRFSILPSGEVANLQLAERSGDPEFDASVLRAVRASSPLGVPPARYREDFANVELTFRPDDLAAPPG